MGTRSRNMTTSGLVWGLLAVAAMAATVAGAPSVEAQTGAQADGAPFTADELKDSRKLHKMARKDSLEKALKLESKAVSKGMRLDVNARDGDGRTPLSYAAEHGSAAMADWLLMRGADPDIADKKQQTALMWLAMPSRKQRGGDAADMARALIEAGADVGATTNGTDNTPLFLSLVGGPYELVDVLLAAGADPNHRDSEGNRALFYAASQIQGARKFPIMEAIAAAGGDMGETKAGMNLLDYSAMRGPAAVPDAHAALFAGMEHTEAYREKVAEIERQAAMQRVLSDPNAPLPCEPTTFENMSPDQGEAVKYLIEQKRAAEGGPQPGRHFCIESIVANQKIPMRGNTVVKYRANYHFLRGYNMRCAPERRRNEGNAMADLEWFSECGPFTGSVVRPGSRQYDEGSVEI